MYDLLARYYDLIHQSLTEDYDLILKLASEGNGPILELGCGTGRLLLPLASAGHIVTGVDNSTAMLARAGLRLASVSEEVQERVTLVKADMKKLSLLNEGTRFSLALFPYNTLLHFQRNEIRVTFKGVAGYLRSDGRLFLDVINPYAIEGASYEVEPSLENIFVDPDSGDTIRQMSDSRLAFSDQCLHTTWTFETQTGPKQTWARSTISFDYWYQYPHQLELLLQQSGFKIEQMMGDYDGSPFSEESNRLLMMARKLA